MKRGLWSVDGCECHTCNSQSRTCISQACTDQGWRSISSPITYPVFLSSSHSSTLLHRLLHQFSISLFLAFQIFQHQDHPTINLATLISAFGKSTCSRSRTSVFCALLPNNRTRTISGGLPNTIMKLPILFCLVPISALVWAAWELVPFLMRGHRGAPGSRNLWVSG